MATQLCPPRRVLARGRSGDASCRSRRSRRGVMAGNVMAALACSLLLAPSVLATALAAEVRTLDGSSHRIRVDDDAGADQSPEPVDVARLIERIEVDGRGLSALWCSSSWAFS